jgi:hypothetical protein
MMTEMKKLTALILLAGLFVGVSSAQAVNSKAGTYAYSFLKIPVGAKAPAMGGASTGLADDQTATFYNPAGITSFEGSSVFASYNNYLAGMQGGYLSYVTSWGQRSSIGLAVDYLNYGTMTRADSLGRAQGEFGGGDLALSITFAYRWPSAVDNIIAAGDPYDEIQDEYMRWSGLSVGATAKLIYEKLEDYTSDALAVDLGVIYGLNDQRTRLGVSASNLGFQMKSFSSGHEDSMPAILRAGVGHRLKAAPIAIAADVVKPFDNDAYFAVGLNLTRFQPLEIRAGYSTVGQNYRTDSSMDNWAGLSFGLGLKLSRFVFEYAFIPYADLGNSHRIAVSKSW